MDAEQRPEYEAFVTNCEIAVQMAAVIPPQIDAIVQKSPVSKSQLESVRSIVFRSREQLISLSSYHHLGSSAESQGLMNTLEPVLEKITGLFRRQGVILSSHVAGNSVWSYNESHDTDGVSRLLHLYCEILGLSLKFLSLPPIGSTGKCSQCHDHTQLIQACTELRTLWTQRSTGFAYDPRPIEDFLDFFTQALVAKSFVPCASIEALSNGAPPPAYETLYNEEKSRDYENNPTAATERVKIHTEARHTNTASETPLIQPQASLSIHPNSLVSLPRETKQSERVQLMFTPDRSSVMAWSMTSIDLYSITTGDRLWHLGTDRPVFKGLSPTFIGNVSFSPDGTLFCITINIRETDELFVFDSRTTKIRAWRPFRNYEERHVAISNNCKQLAISTLFPDEEPGMITIFKLEIGDHLFLPRLDDQQGPLVYQLRALWPSAIAPPRTIQTSFSANDSHLIIIAGSCENDVGTETIAALELNASALRNVYSHTISARQRMQGSRLFFCGKPTEDAFGCQHGHQLVLLDVHGSGLELIDSTTNETVIRLDEPDADRDDWETLDLFRKRAPGVEHVSAAFDDETSVYTCALHVRKGNKAKVFLKRGYWRSWAVPEADRNDVETLKVDLEGLEEWQMSDDGKMALMYDRRNGQILVQAL